MRPRWQLHALLFAPVFAFAITGAILYAPDLLADPRLIVQPWLLQQGYVPYVQIYDEHAPLWPELLAWMQRIVGRDPVTTLRWAHAALVAGSVGMTILVTARRYGSLAAATAGIFIWAFSLRFGWWAAWYDLALTPIYILVYWIATRQTARDIVRFALLGTLIGIAVLIKQHAAVLLATVILPLLLARLRRNGVLGSAKVLAGVLVGGFAPFAIYFAYYTLGQGGHIADWFYWNVLFNLIGAYASAGFLAPEPLHLAAVWPALVVVAGYILLPRQPSTGTNDGTRWVLLGVWVGAVVLQYPRYSIPHWAPSLPFVALMAGAIVGRLAARYLASPSDVKRVVFAPVIVLLLFWSGQGAIDYWYRIYDNRVPEALKLDSVRPLAATLRPHVPSGEPILILPDNEATANLYYLLDTPPAGHWVMHYPWFDRPEVVSGWLESVAEGDVQTVILFEAASALPAGFQPVLDLIEEEFVESAVVQSSGQAVRVMRRSQIVP